ncbi:LPS assembly protein LptD [Phycisphaerales bacterium AB-hyl4]|uniref:LPS assembly protein LptD n=1 Tax=Natronomicrosphaera hydrolytica TaxID=3242702 RepID=A0ABV4U2C5_9BACT
MPAVIRQCHLNRVGLVQLCACLLAWLAAPAWADTVVLDADAHLAARRATTWQQDQAEYVLLEGETAFQMGAYGFHADRALVRIVTETRGEQTVRHMAVYLDDARPLVGEGRAPVAAEADRLLVTGSTAARIKLEVDLKRDAQPSGDDPFVNAGQSRIARYDLDATQRRAAGSLAPATPPLLAAQQPARQGGSLTDPPPEQPTVEPAPEPGAPREPGQADDLPDLPDDLATLEVDEPEQPRADTVLPTTGTVRFRTERVVFEREPDESALMLIGDVRLIYEDAADGRSVVLQAERAVIFLAPEAADDAMGDTAFNAGAVQGIYLEDNVVISDGDYTLRAPRIFYDLQRDQAVVLDAVLYTWDVQRQIPLYVRADSVRQTSRTSFEARGAVLTTSEFAQPHFGIGANRVTLDMDRDEAGVMRQYFSASHSTLRVADVPVFYWPYLAGEVRALPIRSVSVGQSRRRGLEVETAWDVFALLGQESPDGIDLTANLDYRGTGGPGIGAELDYNIEGARGQLRGYLLPTDSSEDRFGRRVRIEQDNETRGYVRFEHRQTLPDNWHADLEAAYVSDETFLESYFPDEAHTARPYQTAIYLLKQEPDWAFDLQASTQLTDFTEQLTTLQAPGFQLERQPEVGYYRTGTSLFADRATWYTENRFSRIKANFGRDTPADRGFREQQALDLFGTPPDVRFTDAADAVGFDQDWRLRVDSRHEINVPMELGPLSITPYVVGRVTAYDDDFEAYAGEDDQYRLWGSLGTRFSTQFQRSYDRVDNRVLNLNRLRHLIEPSINVFYAATTVDAGDLPPYEADVEDIADGPGIRLGLRQTLQTQRGGPGRWRSVDWFTLQTDLVFRSSDGNRDRQPLARFYDYRPEFARGGNHFYTEARWQVSDVLGTIGDLTFDFHDEQVSQWRLGASLQHTPRLRSFLHYRNIRPINSQWLGYGFTYELTRKYTISATQRFDLRENESRNIDFWLERRLPRARLRFIASFDQIDNEQVFGISFTPEGFAARNPFGVGQGGW